MAAHGKRTDASQAVPDNEVADFEEYCALYREAWSQPAVRWLFSVIPTAMIFDDHDVHDDWNTSAQWRAGAAARPRGGRPRGGALPNSRGCQHPRHPSPARPAHRRALAQQRPPG